MNNLRMVIKALPEDTVVVSGHADGIDSLAESWAIQRGLKTLIFRAQWKTLGHGAGFIRNVLIVEAADRVVAFWDGGSRGTAHTIRTTKLHEKPLTIYYGDGRVEKFNMHP